MGIAEADMIDTAVGLAATGKLVFASTFAMFAVGKPWEQIRNSAAYSGVTLNIVATHSGISVGEDGSSHQCIEDMALVRIIPGTTVIAPADDIATYALVMKLAEHKGLSYMRLTRPDLPRIYPEGESFEIGKAKVLRKGTQATIVATGSLVWPSLQAADILASEGISIGVIDMHTVKPLDSKPVIEAAERTGFIVTAEEHTVIGGLGEAVSSLLSECCPTRVKRIGIKDRFGESGSCDELMDFFGFTPEAIAKEIKEAQAL
jgi:transketolase